ncbi:MAG TPA: IS21-like element helper ATPase IstB [Gemmatimonadaceae bacterium]|nr:IS21-like element helper ATPase IstB [Gemmatimonadaceae bacterium]
MTTPEIEQLTADCTQLRLTKIAATLPTLLEDAAAQELSYSAFLSSVLRTEVASKQEKHHTMRVQMARFPFHKTLDGFDWKAQPSIEPKVIKELATMRFVANGANALLLGPPGVGKTHLSVALGMEACRLGLRVAFTTAAALITTLGKALYENRLDERLKILTQPKLLIIDEIGYIPIDRQGANLFFQLVSRRYERGSILLTNNQSLGAWGDVFGDAVIARAILDRLLHHATTVNIEGESYRLREKRKAGLMRSSLTPPRSEE